MWVVSSKLWDEHACTNFLISFQLYNQLSGLHMDFKIIIVLPDDDFSENNFHRKCVTNISF